MKNIKLLWNHMDGNRLIYLGAIVSVGLAALFTMLGPLVIRVTIDSIIGGQPVTAPFPILKFIEGYDFQQFRSALWVPGLMLISITILRGLFMFLRGKLSAQASESIAKNLRDRLYDHLQHLPYSYHKKADTGDLIQRCTSDVDTIRRFLGAQLVEVGNAVFMITLATYIMVSLDLRMTLISLTVVPFIFAFAVVFFWKVKKAFQETDEAEAEMTTVLQENLTGVRVVRAFANQAYEIDKFEEKNSTYRKQVYHLVWLLACYWGASDFLALGQIAAVVAFGTYFTAQGTLSIGTLVVYTSYIGMLLWPVRQMGRILTDMGKALVAVERIQQILDEPAEILEENHLKPEIKGQITFENVYFGYEPENPVLRGISFSVKPGQTVAILGQTGSGKSSLIHLLARLYDYQAGSIKIDGIELKSIDKKWIRKHIGVVPQEPFLFAKTIRDNITLARSDASDEEVFQAAKEAAIHDVILKFEKGYDTLVGERGVSVSGGQRQRIAIARALITQSPILIFDDSLSAVDTETELAIRDALRSRTRQATTFIISHRITTLMHADLILVLQDGQIVQSGTHAELSTQSGLYKRIWELQSAQVLQAIE
ncbi:MAG: ABC transporter ATP-binding protein [Firmicutes bacterium]|nr:ABC transporter ATP-binding protein [Bacillota bacterium]